MGTPHLGSDKAKLASAVRRVVGAVMPSKVLDTSGQHLETLKEQSETLQNVTDMFAPLMKNFRIYFFWEEKKTNLGASYDYVSTIRLCVGFEN
jgi:protein SERAC1